VATPWTPPPALPEALVSDCRLFASRYQMLGELPRAGRTVEVGTETGGFAKCILATCQPAELHLIDIDFSLLDPAVAGDRRVTLHRGRSHECLARFEDDSLDWVYIDADHTHAAVLRDIHAAAPKVKPGGFLVFNDFAHMDPYLGRYGVHNAVVEFAVERLWPIVFWAYAASGLYDVALRRPS
jgi:cephalosporin hydroxylase